MYQRKSELWKLEICGRVATETKHTLLRHRNAGSEMRYCWHRTFHRCKGLYYLKKIQPKEAGPLLYGRGAELRGPKGFSTLGLAEGFFFSLPLSKISLNFMDTPKGLSFLISREAVNNFPKPHQTQ